MMVPKPYSDFFHRPHIHYFIDFSPIEKHGTRNFPGGGFSQHAGFSPSLNQSLYVVVHFWYHNYCGRRGCAAWGNVITIFALCLAGWYRQLSIWCIHFLLFLSRQTQSESKREMVLIRPNGYGDNWNRELLFS